VIAQPNVYRLRLSVAIAAVVAVMSALAMMRWSVWSYGSDTGTFAQSILNAFHGFANGVEPSGTHLRTHWSPIIGLLWPIVALTRSPLSIQFAQTLLIALTAVPLYAIVRRYAGEAWALRCALLALLYPPLLANAFAEFHELAFYPMLALALIWAADRNRWAWYAIFAVLAVTIREDACVDLVVIGPVLGTIGVLRRHSQRRGLLYGEPEQPRALAAAGFGLAALSAGSLAVYVLVVLPRAGGWTAGHFYRYPFAHGPAQTALAVFTHPIALAEAIATYGRLTFLLEAFVPLAFLALFSRWTLLSLPAFAGILLSSDSSVWRMGMHYVLLAVPWVLLGAAWTLIRTADMRERKAILWWRSAISICVIVLLLFNPMHPVHYLRMEPYAHPAEAQRAFQCIPHGARIATHDEWLAHFALLYPNVTQFRAVEPDFSGYVVYAEDWRNATFAAILRETARLQRDGRYRLICDVGPVRVLRTAQIANVMRKSR
jgi:uncharacterized membrane protein